MLRFLRAKIKYKGNGIPRLSDTMPYLHMHVQFLWTQSRRFEVIVK